MDANFQRLADLVGTALAERWIKVITQRRERDKQKLSAVDDGGGVAASPVMAAETTGSNKKPRRNH